MNIKQFRKMGGEARWTKMTEEQRAKHIEKMTAKSLESRAKNKAKSDLPTV